VTAGLAPGPADRLVADPDRLFPPDRTERAIARELYADVRLLPIVSPHGHVDARVLADDLPFGDPAALLIAPDHYVTRMLHAYGEPLTALGHRDRVTGAEPAAPREVWRTFCEHWTAFRGTPTRHWLEAELVELFDLDLVPGPDTADALFDALADRLARPEFRPRAMLDRFGIEVLATTDDPADDLAAHAVLAADEAVTARVLPTFRPDRYLDASAAGWEQALDRLGAVTGHDTGSYRGLLSALADRRAFFLAHGGTATDHGHPDAGCTPLEPDRAAALFDRLRAAGNAHPSDADVVAFRGHMLFEMARMSSEDGLVMQLHPGVLRNYDRAALDAFGPDTGHDIPVATEFTRALRPILEAFGNHPRFRMVAFTVDETVWSRELAPLAGYFPGFYVGVPWWFLDSPDTFRRFRAAVTDSAGFGKTSGFIDDTRAFCSIPARHDMARRLDAGFLARYVAEGRLRLDEAHDTAHDLAHDLPLRVFRL